MGDPLQPYDFELPPERIAQHPAARRRQARLLAWRAGGRLEDRGVEDLPSLLAAGDLLVLNDTRVFPARLRGVKEAGGAAVEVLLTDPLEDGTWEALVRPGRRLAEGAAVRLEGGARLVVGERRADGRRRVRLGEGNLLEWARAHGHVPLPPYIQREDRPEDRLRYQTVFAREEGSVAAPTAGLHLDEALLEEIHARGVETAWVTLHVGPGTFRPVGAADLARGALHAERFAVPGPTVQALCRCRERGGRIVAVGTTACRSLESLPERPEGAVSGRTTLLIAPPFPFRWVDVLVTNFHLPRSSLLLLVAAFAGPGWRRAYAHAVEAGYRFYSYGDANWIERGAAE